MITVTTFDASGQILRWMEMPTEQDIIANLDPDELAMPGKFLPGTGYVSFDFADPWTTAAVVPLPDRPSPDHVFDYTEKAWTDPRTPTDLAAALTARRNTTSLDKSDLLIRLAIAGVLTPEEAEEAASGVIPASMAPMMGAMPPDAQMAARIKWRSDTTISRTHPVIVAAAYALGISDEQLDQIFGVMP